MLNFWQTIASRLTNRSLIQIYEEEAFHLHSTDYKNTNPRNLSELRSSQEETDTRFNLYCMHEKHKGYRNVRVSTPDSDIFFI